MVRKKKIIASLIAMALSLSIVGCGNSAGSSSKSVNTAKQVQEQQQKENIESTIKSSSEKQDTKEPETTIIKETITYKTYQNGRYGFSINYPSAFETKILPSNGDGIILSSPNGQTELTVSGINNVLSDTVTTLYNQQLKEHNDIKYKKLSSNWYILSWIEHDKIIYLKSVVGSGSINTFIIKYPIKEKEAYDPIISTLNSSFKTPSIDEVH